MKTKIFLFPLFFLYCLNVLCQQEPYIYFDSIYDCNNNKYATAFTTYETGYGYFTAGISYWVTGKVICVLKTDKYGNKLEVKNFGRSGCDIWPGTQGSQTKTTDGGYALGGGLTSSLNDKVLLVKFNANGDTVWTRAYGDNISGSFYTGRQCKQTWDKGFIIVGEKDMGGTNEDVLLVKTDSLGNLQWQKTYGGPYLDFGWTIAVTPDSGFIIGGYTYRYGYNYTRNALVIKTDSLGNVQWQKEFGGPFDDGLAVVNVAKDGNFIVGFAYATAQPYPMEPSFCRFNLIKFNPSGSVILDKKYGISRSASGLTFVNVLNNGNIIAVGYGDEPPNHSKQNGMILCVNHNGDSIWMRDYERVNNSGSANILYHIQPTSDKGLITSGYVFGAFEPPNGRNFWLVKLDSMGCLEPNCDGTIIIDPYQKNNEYILKVFPNPAKDKSNISLQGFKTLSGLTLSIYNIQGQLLLQQTLQNNNLEIDISGLEAGVYIAKIKLSDGSFVQERFVVIK